MRKLVGLALVVAVLLFIFWKDIKPGIYKAVGFVDDSHEKVEKAVDDVKKNKESIDESLK